MKLKKKNIQGNLSYTSLGTSMPIAGASFTNGFKLDFGFNLRL